MTLITNPYSVFLDGRGMLLDGGFIYIGQPNTDPTIPANQLQVYRDPDFTVPITQPLRTLGGVIVEGRNKIFTFVDAADHSIVVRDAQGDLVYSVASVDLGGVAYQPLDASLSALAGVTVTDFGKGLLGLANEAGLKVATGIPNCLPLSGGILSGNVTRAGAGPHLYHNDAAYESGRLFVTEAGAPDPTTLPGDIWLELS